MRQRFRHALHGTAHLLPIVTAVDPLVEGDGGLLLAVHTHTRLFATTLSPAPLRLPRCRFLSTTFCRLHACLHMRRLRASFITTARCTPHFARAASAACTSRTALPHFVTILHSLCLRTADLLRRPAPLPATFALLPPLLPLRCITTAHRRTFTLLPPRARGGPMFDQDASALLHCCLPSLHTLPHCHCAAARHRAAPAALSSSRRAASALPAHLAHSLLACCAAAPLPAAASLALARARASSCRLRTRALPRSMGYHHRAMAASKHHGAHSALAVLAASSHLARRIASGLRAPRHSHAVAHRWRARIIISSRWIF